MVDRNLTCPVEPVALKFFSVVSVKDLVDADDVARLIGKRPAAGGLERRPGDRGRFLVDVDQVVAEIAQILRLEPFKRRQPGRLLPLFSIGLLPVGCYIVEK